MDKDEKKSRTGSNVFVQATTWESDFIRMNVTVEASRLLLIRIRFVSWKSCMKLWKILSDGNQIEDFCIAADPYGKSCYTLRTFYRF